ncbi:NepR family anti-sigma factor [Pseudogemmobacter sp. W21_MBD1_M6]|jgi:hypothetical protein|uniref:NepR family anti-sigma factor n=1 Tax=Pseudogemmobacter sp. W21_MBD1_M6 TaxID=3240271 RepID=UPI003F94C906
MAQKKPNQNVQRQIDENLRKVYQEKVEEALPDRFQKLLQQLKEQEKAKEGEK